MICNQIDTKIALPSVNQRVSLTARVVSVLESSQHRKYNCFHFVSCVEAILSDCKSLTQNALHYRLDIQQRLHTSSIIQLDTFHQGQDNLSDDLKV